MRWSGTGSKPAASDVVVNVASRAQLLEVLDVQFAEGQGFSLATLNLDHVVKLRKSPEFKEAYLRQTYVTADGNPIVWFSRLAGQDVSLVPGSELIEPVVALAVRHDVPIALFGATQHSLEAAAAELKRRFPELRIAAALAPPMGFDPTGSQADAYIEDLKTSGAGLCFIALGAPKQEIFAAYASERIPNMGFLSIGAGLDFISGAQIRAPKIARAFAAEWLWRLGQNPRRLARRYGACIAVLPSLFYLALKTRFPMRNGDVS